MKTITSNDLLFLEYCKKVSIEHPDILAHMIRSPDTLTRVIAKRILAVAEGCENV